VGIVWWPIIVIGLVIYWKGYQFSRKYFYSHWMDYYRTVWTKNEARLEIILKIKAIFWPISLPFYIYLEPWVARL
jgi:hypothetical protein